MITRAITCAENNLLSSCKIGNNNTFLSSLLSEIQSMTYHMILVRHTWEKENSKIYFLKVALTISRDACLQDSVCMLKEDIFKVDENVKKVILKKKIE